jgi:Ca2+-binding RTX toxin-like protein
MSDNDIRGTDGPDRLVGTAGADEIRGEEGNDRLLGRGGNDVLRGDEGNDFLSGGAGNDRLRGDKGDDTLTGGIGNDRFIFNLQGGDDIVADYTDGQDRLDFTNFDFESVSDVLSHAAQSGEDVVFTLPTGTTVTLQNVQLSTLGNGDFLI